MTVIDGDREVKSSFISQLDRTKCLNATRGMPLRKVISSSSGTPSTALGVKAVSSEVGATPPRPTAMCVENAWGVSA